MSDLFEIFIELFVDLMLDFYGLTGFFIILGMLVVGIIGYIALF